jgi:methylenetetrahydrofolate--tRNA-(uracil-5-)-methyltransferase
MDVAWMAARWDKGGKDYINCPMTRSSISPFVGAERRREDRVQGVGEGHALFRRLHADRGDGRARRETLRFGPMKPVGLDDPRTGRWPYAVVQLRQDNALGTLWNMVGFQTKLKHAEQVRIFRTIPGWRMPSSRGSAASTATPSSIRPSCSTARCG